MEKFIWYHTQFKNPFGKYSLIFTHNKSVIFWDCRPFKWKNWVMNTYSKAILWLTICCTRVDFILGWKTMVRINGQYNYKNESLTGYTGKTLSLLNITILVQGGGGISVLCTKRVGRFSVEYYSKSDVCSQECWLTSRVLCAKYVRILFRTL